VLSCHAGGRRQGVWKDESSRRQRPNPSIVSLAHWVGNANRPDVLPIEAALADSRSEEGPQRLPKRQR